MVASAEGRDRRLLQGAGPVTSPEMRSSKTDTDIPGLVILDLPVHRDERGWFKENWQQEKMTAAGLPDFEPVQQNVSYNVETGVTRGIHAEPWDKLVSVATGRVFGAWVDLREGETFGRVFTTELGPERTVFVPRGVGNAYQTLEPRTTYCYLVNDHWSPSARSRYTYLNLADESVAIEWPVPLDRATVSVADRQHPRLVEVRPFTPGETLILGGEGQIGRAVSRRLPGARKVSREQLDITSLQDWDWTGVETVINAAAYTDVDACETDEGRRRAWSVNAAAVRDLAELSRRHGFKLVHISSDYVFDGQQREYCEEDPVSPLGVYGQSKAAGDLAAAGTPRHYIIRTSWVMGDGANFIRTMASLADRGESPTVVSDQRGRLAFADTVAAAIVHLLESRASFGIYNVTNSGKVVTWYDVARDVFRLRGRSVDDVRAVSTKEYAQGKNVAPRPLNSLLALDKICATGFCPEEAAPLLRDYVEALSVGSGRD